jgi:hypothetical protein
MNTRRTAGFFGTFTVAGALDMEIVITPFWASQQDKKGAIWPFQRPKVRRLIRIDGIPFYFNALMDAEVISAGLRRSFSRDCVH